MVRGYCPDCEQLVELQPTQQHIIEGKSARWWCVEQHLVDVRQRASGVVLAQLCPGSGKRI